FIAEKDAVLGIAADLVLLNKIIGILVTDRDSVTAIIFQDVFFEQSVPHAPAEEQPVLAVSAGDTAANDRPLRTTAGMHSKPGVSLTGAIFYQHVVGLLKTDAVSIEITNDAIPNNCAKTAIQENASAATPIERNILVLVAVDGQILEAGAFEVVAAHDWKNRRGLGVIGHHTIRIQGCGKRERIAVPSSNPPDRRMKPS